MRRRHWLLGGIDICYGTINHYLSEFFYLCLGYREADLGKPSGPGIDAVFAGHAHWSIEFKLKRPNEVRSDTSWKPEVYYGRFSHEVQKGCGRAGPLVGTLVAPNGRLRPAERNR